MGIHQMAMELPAELVAAVREGRAVLFLGAGASRGASDGKGNTPPDGTGLGKTLAKEFLGDGYEHMDLRSIYDLACSERDVRTVQRRIHEILDPFRPGDFHLLIPTFPWAGLATTNYDLVVERAYAKSNSKSELIPNTKDGDGATDRFDGSRLLYIKLHGCITRHQEVDPPMIASTDQLISFRDGRTGQFDTFLEWAKTKTVIFCGYSFMDMNLRTLFDEVIKEGDKRPRHYIINKGAKPAEINYWRDRRVVAFDATFEEVLRALDDAVSQNQRALGAVAAIVSQTPFSRFITTAGASESESLQRYLGSLLEHIPPEIAPSAKDPKQFYSGFDLGWSPYSADLDIRQPVVGEILRDYIEQHSANDRLPIVLIKGHAGSGKTVSLRRICYDAATAHGKLCFYASRQHKLVPERFDEIFSLTNVPVHLFVDDVSIHRKDLLEVIELARRRKAKLRIFAAETFHLWNILCDDLDPYVHNALEMRYLSEANIERLLQKLDQHGCLGYLAPLGFEKRKDELKDIHGRQLLVALMEATHGQPLIEIIKREFESIEPIEARRIYLDICSLHRFGPPVRAGLISRIHNISFEDFAERFFAPLEAIVVLRQDRRSGDYVYEARHSLIAHELYNAILVDQAERFDNLIRIVNKLNPAFSYDQEVLARIVRCENLRTTLNDDAKIRQVYEAAEAAFGDSAVISHQRGIFEMAVANNMGGLARAEELLEKALEKEPFNRSIKHSRAELDLRRSRMSQDPQEKIDWRRSAVKRASELTHKSTSPYPHHTLLKAAIDGVKEALQSVEDHPSDTNTQNLSDAIAHAEATLRTGRQAFPNEAVLLNEEGQLSIVLAAAERAEKSFDKAFLANPRSTLIARRVGRIKKAKGNFDEAIEVLRTCLEHNPGSADIHYDLAIAILESKPDADQTESDTLLYHLRRAFTPGDKNRQAQFWYARQLALAGRFAEAKPIFAELADARIAYREKLVAKGMMCNTAGEPLEHIGSISLWRETWGFIHLASPEMSVFFPLSACSGDIADYLAVGATVRFKLAFTLKGPIAVDVNI